MFPEALKVLTKAEPGESLPIAAKTKALKIPRRRPTAERVRHSFEIVQHGMENSDHTTWTFAKEIILADAMFQQEPVAEVEIQVIQVGAAVFVANRSELFCQIGLDI